MTGINIIFVFLLLANNLAFAQKEKYSAPIIWQRYAVSANDVSVLLPKLPVARIGGDACRQFESKSYYAYADEVIYSFKFTAKTDKKPPAFCRENRGFGKKDFLERLREIRSSLKDFEESKSEIENREVTVFKSKDSTVWLFDDFENNRWFELSVSHREDAEFDKKVFFDSIKIGKNPQGTEIGDGAEQILGDAKPAGDSSDQFDLTNKASSKEGIKPLNIIVKVPPRYTDAARQNNVRGTITLRVTFLYNGGIGEVTPVSDLLPFGLTEQAIAAAKRMAFLPQKSGNNTQTVVKIVQYTFSIY